MTKPAFPSYPVGVCDASVCGSKGRLHFKWTLRCLEVCTRFYAAGSSSVVLERSSDEY